MVGSILTSVEEGQKVARTDELGYFAFGESTDQAGGKLLIVRWIDYRAAV